MRDSTLTDQDDADYQALQSAYDTVTLRDLNDPVGGLYRIRGRYIWSEDIEFSQFPPCEPTTETDPDDFTYSRDQDAFEEVNVYYHIDTFRRYIGTLGFSPKWNNLDYIKIDAQGYGNHNAAYYASPEYIRFGSGGVDAGEDQTVIIHEYGHALHDALISGDGTDDPNSDTRGISEGIADYFGISYRRTTQENPYRPNHRFNWFSPEDGTSIRIPENAHYPEPSNGGHWGSSEYDKMKVWASTLMDMEYNTATDPSQGTNLGRDVTTELMLTSMSYVTSSSSVQDYVNAILQADRDIQDYNGEHIQELANIFNDRGFFYYDKVSGNITSNTTWENCKWITGNVTVNSGVTLTISPGAFLFFDDDTRLTVNGTLIAEGTVGTHIVFTSSNTTPSSGDWYGIRFEDSSVDANCIVKYCEIQNAQYGIYCNQANPTIQNNSLSNSNYGIYLYYSSPDIETNSITDNDRGIYGTSSNPAITDNLIRGHSCQGISFSGGSPEFYDNTIDENYYGALFDNTSCPAFGPTSDSSKGNNVIADNSYYGIYGRHFSEIFMGSHDYQGDRIGGYNSICDNTVGDAVAYYLTDFEAEYNWWGTSPIRTATYYSSINYANELGSDPGGGSSLAKSVVLAEDKWDGFDPNNPDINSLSDLWLLGEHLFINNQLEEAIDVYKMLVNKFSDDNYANRALVRIKNLYNKTGKDGLTGYLCGLLHNSKIDNNVHQVIYPLLIDAYLGDREKTAIYAMVLTMLNDLNDIERASKYTEVLKQKYPDDELTYMARAAMGETVNWSLEKPVIEPECAEVSLPDRYALHNNYPNPFNPSTTICFDLPEPAKVSFVIYDILGREVWSGNRIDYSAGRHSIIWNGTNNYGSPVATGMYIIQMITPKYTGMQKILLIQ